VAVDSSASQPANSLSAASATPVLVTSPTSSGGTEAAALAGGANPADGTPTGSGLAALQNGTDFYAVTVH
jgi:hypothetical protein